METLTFVKKILCKIENRIFYYRYRIRIFLKKDNDILLFGGIVGGTVIIMYLLLFIMIMSNKYCIF